MRRPLQPRSRAGETHEAAAANLRRALEVEQPETCADLQVVLRLISLGKDWWFTPCPHHRVVRRVFADGRGRVGEIRDVEQE